MALDPCLHFSIAPLSEYDWNAMMREKTGETIRHLIEVARDMRSFGREIAYRRACTQLDIELCRWRRFNRDAWSARRTVLWDDAA